MALTATLKRDTEEEDTTKGNKTGPEIGSLSFNKDVSKRREPTILNAFK